MTLKKQNFNDQAQNNKSVNINIEAQHMLNPIFLQTKHSLFRILFEQNR